MSDRTDVRITICGDLKTREALTGLIDAIEREGLGLDWNQPVADENEIRQAIMEAVTGGATVTFYDDQCNYGTLGTLEEFCQNAGLAYTRVSGDGSEYDAEAVSWCPGMDQPVQTPVDQGGNPLIEYDILTPLVNIGAEEALARLQDLVSRAGLACGIGLPEALTASPDVRAALEAAT